MLICRRTQTEGGEKMTFESLMNDEQFLERLYEAKDIAEVKVLFLSEGVEVTEEELMSKLLPGGEDLTEDDLESVSGGGAIINWFRNLLGGGKGAFGGGGSMGGR